MWTSLAFRLAITLVTTAGYVANVVAVLQFTSVATSPASGDSVDRSSAAILSSRSLLSSCVVGDPSSPSVVSSVNGSCVGTFPDSSTFGPAAADSSSSSSSGSADQRAVYWQTSAGIRWFTYASPIIIAVATVGSVMSVVVLQSPEFRRSSTSFILSALAVVDGVVVNTGLLRMYIITLIDVDVRSFSAFSCKFHMFLTYYSHQVNM